MKGHHIYISCSAKQSFSVCLFSLWVKYSSKIWEVTEPLVVHENILLERGRVIKAVGILCEFPDIPGSD